MKKKYCFFSRHLVLLLVFWRILQPRPETTFQISKVEPGSEDTNLASLSTEIGKQTARYLIETLDSNTDETQIQPPT